MEDFYKPKIVYGQFQDCAEYSFADKDIFLSSNEYMLISNNYSPKCILAFLNCKAIEWLLGQITGSLSGNSKIGQKSNFLKLAIPILSITQQNPFIELVTQILENKKHNRNTYIIEKQIDIIVYDFYNLDEEEIKYIENA